MKKILLYTFTLYGLLFAFSISLFSQSSIRGYVKLGPNGTPMVGVEIMLKGTASGTITDQYGSYAIGVASGQPVTLVASYIGYTSIEKNLTPDPGPNFINFWLDPPSLPSDYDDNYYHTVTIGNQTWMVENLAVTHFRDGSNIPYVTGNLDWTVLTSSGYCWYNNDFSNYLGNYGALYNWYTVNTDNLCPIGWHIPTDVEWHQMITFIDPAYVYNPDVPFVESDIGGGMLKESGTVHWLTPNDGATNETGFTALPGGYRGTDGSYGGLYGYGYWWSSTGDGSNSWTRRLGSTVRNVFRWSYDIKEGHSIRCINDILLPTLATKTYSGLTLNSAQSGGSITDDGGADVTARGVCWSTNPNPTVALSTKTSDGIGTGDFFSNISGLTSGTTYYVRAYATNSAGTSYGNEFSFTTYRTDAITDAEGNYYNIVTIGSQVWIAENLKTTKYNDGSDIPNVIDNTAWDALTSPAYAWYDNNIANKEIYGALYNWYAVETGELCPVGWHAPTDDELTVLAVNAGGESVAGGNLKEIGNAHWNNPNDGATDEYGFTALPGGARLLNGAFYYIGGLGIWWSSTDTLLTNAWYRFIHNNDIRFSRIYDGKAVGLSVRCIKNNIPLLSTSAIKYITKSTAYCGGHNISDGGSAITQKGVCWSTSHNPTIVLATKTSDGTGSGDFYSYITNLTPGTTYYLRAYATNSIGTAYGNEISFTTYKSDAITDIEGNLYNIVTIGSQVWMADNLKTTLYKDGTKMPEVVENATWASLTTPGYCWYNNDSIKYNIPYGALYNWYSVNTGKLCPVGWHVPSDNDWTILENYLIASGYNFDGTTSGNKIAKSLADTKYWNPSTEIGAPGNSDYSAYRNKTGFSALPGGIRFSTGPFYGLSTHGYWWSATENNSSDAWFRIIYSDLSYVERPAMNKAGGYSVRCIKDVNIISPTVVTNTSDSGVGSLRNTIEYANSTVGVKDTITFDITGTGPFTIQPLAPLPEITDPVVINGYSQPGASAAYSKLLIQIDGSNIDLTSYILSINGVSNCIIKGLIINRFSSDGIRITNSDGNVITGNQIGAAISEPSSLTTGTGIRITGGKSNIIGGKTLSERNIISGNPDVGIWLAGGTNNNQIKGNFIGTDISGTKKIPNGIGICIFPCQNNIIGGTEPEEGNLISGNLGDGILFKGGDALHPAEGNKVQGNYIGTDYSGLEPLGNTRDGIMYYSSARNNLIGGTDQGSGNIIAFNGSNGIEFTASLNPGNGNAILSNSIHSNAGLGIDLKGDGVTQNDPNDPDPGPNNLQNYPVLDSIKFDLGKKTVFVSGYLQSTPNRIFTLQFFTNKVGDFTGHGEGETFLGFARDTTGSDGKATFRETFTIYSSWGDVISATATDAAGNTSEFSQDIGGLQNQIIPPYKWPFTYKTNADGVLRITDGSDIAAVDSAYRTWTMIPTATIDFRNGSTTPTKYASANDGINLVTFTDDQFPFSPGVIAVAAKTLKLIPGSTDAEIIDADIVVNPLFARYDIGVGYNNPNEGTYDIQSLITHEIGHVLGLLHSGVYNSSLFYILYPGTRVRSLEQDDKSWVSYRYPKATYSTTYGSISGNITYGYDGQPVAGVLVLAINTSTKDTVHAYSDVSGDYLVPGLRPGSYNIYIEPLDGSIKVHKLKPGNISAYVYCNTVYTDYPGEFYSNPESDSETTDVPKSVAVSAGQETKNIDLITNKDLTGPKVVSIYPPNDTINISVTDDIIITYSESVDQTTLTNLTCFLESGGIKHGVTYTAIGNSTRTILVSPDSALKYSTTYTIHITKGVTDLRGNPLQTEYQSQFTTKPADLVPPEITGSYPVDGADSVFVMEKVIVFFSEPMNRSSVENSFSLTWPEGTPAIVKKVDGSFTWDDENTSVTFVPSGSLKEGTKYTIALSGVATDQSDNHLTASTFSFTTIPNAAPAIIYLGPLNLEQEVSINTPIVADFSEPIDTTSVSTSTFSLKLNGVQVPGKFEFLNANSRVIFRSDANLEFGKSYAIKITTLIQDVSVPSLHMKRDSVTAFTTASQPTVPSIYSLEPSYGTIGSKVVISGKGFDPNPVKNTVKFNGISAAIADATLTTLITNVPLGALSGMVTVTGINGVPADNSLYFGVIPQSDNPCENITANSPVGTKSTKDVSVTPDNAFAYVTNPEDNTVTVVDLITSTVVKSISVGKTPMKIDINPAGTLAYVTNFYSNDVSVINLATNSVIKTIKVGVGPYGITVTPDGKVVYVANYYSETVSLIDTDPNSGGFDHVVANTQTGSKTSNVVTTPDAAMVLVTGDFGLKIIDAKPKDANYNCVVATVSSGTKTRDVAVTPDAGLAIVSTEEGNLLIINLHPENGDYSDAVIASVPSGTKVSDVKVSGDNMFVYVTASDKNEILVYQLTQGGAGTSGGSTVPGISLVLHSTITGITAPEGMVINDKADKLYIINGPSGSRLVSTIQLCCGPVDPASVIGDLITSIQNMVRNGSIPAPQGKNLINKLNAALKDLQNNKTKSVINDLNAFVNQVKNLMADGKIKKTIGQPLVDNANIIIKQLKGIKSAAIGYSFINSGPVDIEPVTESKLGLIYPNPSNESFIINYEIANDNVEFSKVIIKVYDINGEHVKILVDKTLETGRYSAGWNSNYDNGKRAPGGTYFVHFRTGNVETVRKIILIR